MPLHFAPAEASRYSQNYWLPANSSLVQESRVNPWPTPDEGNLAPSSSPTGAPFPEDAQICSSLPLWSWAAWPGVQFLKGNRLSVCLYLSVSVYLFQIWQWLISSTGSEGRIWTEILFRLWTCEQVLYSHAWNLLFKWKAVNSPGFFVRKGN